MRAEVTHRRSGRFRSIKDGKLVLRFNCWFTDCGVCRPENADFWRRFLRTIPLLSQCRPQNYNLRKPLHVQSRTVSLRSDVAIYWQQKTGLFVVFVVGTQDFLKNAKEELFSFYHAASVSFSITETLRGAQAISCSNLLLILIWISAQIPLWLRIWQPSEDAYRSALRSTSCERGDYILFTVSKRPVSCISHSLFKHDTAVLGASKG